MWDIYTIEYYLVTKKNRILSFVAMRMDLEIVILSEIRQGKTNIIRYHIYVHFKNKTDELIYKID